MEMLMVSEIIKDFMTLHGTRREFVNAVNQIQNETDREVIICGNSDSVQIYKGINIIADALGFFLGHNDRNSTEFPHEYSFIYDGVKYFQVEERELKL